MPDSDKMVIGLTGPFGSGCSKISNYFESESFQPISLSQILKASCARDTGIPTDNQSRRIFQDYGDQLRHERGLGYLAQQASETIHLSSENNWVVDSIKNPNEVKYFRNNYSNFYLIGVFADYKTRWERVGEKRYKSRQDEFNVDDKRDRGDEETKHGQRVRDCFAISDFIVLNNTDYKPGSKLDLDMGANIRNFLELIEHPQSAAPSEIESLMTVAYATSLRSSCQKRKVGAIIIDERGFIISSGYNEVPFGEDSCLITFGGCYKDQVKQEIVTDIEGIIEDDGVKAQVKNVIKKRIKMLDLCRALHAEENAILKIPHGIDLSKATLYTTTYPCNLCANKIAQKGINKIVYLEPYPQIEAKELLTSRKIKQESFEGITYHGYFKLYGGDYCD